MILHGSDVIVGCLPATKYVSRRCPGAGCSFVEKETLSAVTINKRLPGPPGAGEGGGRGSVTYAPNLLHGENIICV